MTPSRAYPVILLVGCFLLLTFLYINHGKVDIARYYIDLVQKGDPVKRLLIKDDKGNEVVKLSMPTSDLWDYTGSKTLNYHYLDKKELTALSKALEQPGLSFSINKTPLKKGEVGIIRQHENVLSITLPKNKLYILAPPHLKMAMMALKFERDNRTDIFSCRGVIAFCQSIRISQFIGLSTLEEASLAKDRIFDDDPLPRGRWISGVSNINFNSAKKQRMRVRYTLRTMMVGQQVRIKRPRDAQLKIIIPAALKKRDLPQFFSLVDYEFEVIMDLKKGSNALEIEFSGVTEGNIRTPAGMAGILTKLEMLPVL